jgi:plasmid segregation protein ParM
VPELHQNGIALDGLTSKDVLNSGNLPGIDIGEDTVNFPVFTSGKFNIDLSSTVAGGYGIVLEMALEPLSAHSNGFENQKSLAEFLQKTPSVLSKTIAEKHARLHTHKPAFLSSYHRYVQARGAESKR